MANTTHYGDRKAPRNRSRQNGGRKKTALAVKSTTTTVAPNNADFLKAAKKEQKAKRGMRKAKA